MRPITRSATAASESLIFMVGKQSLFTIGYEGANQADFIASLEADDIRLLADLRELPLSRKAGFSKRALANALQAHGIDYLHIRELGCPRWIRARYRRDHDWNHYSEDFTRYLATQNRALETLAQLAARQSTALMCFEADAARCHRSIVAAALHRTHAFTIVDLAP